MELFDPNNDFLSETTKVATSTWTNNTNKLTSAITASTQAVFTTATSSGAFFVDVHNDATTSSVQYSVAYGHKAGSGSLAFNASAPSYSPTSVIYNQYRQLIYGDSTTNFSFNGYTPDDIYVINVNRSRYKHNLKPGTLNLFLGSGSATTVAGRASTLHLTDDSITTTGSAIITNAGRQFNIVSGSSGVMSGSTLTGNHPADSGSYGFFYPDSGFMILNPSALSFHLSGGVVNTAPAFDSGSYGALTPQIASNTANNNHLKLLKSIDSGSNFEIDSEEKVSAQYYFARVKNRSYNYSSNPTFRDSSGNLVYSDMESNPKVYITTVGLYDTPGNLIAVAKLSQPIAKEFSKEALIRIKLDY